MRFYRANGTYFQQLLSIEMWADDTYIYFYAGNIDIGYGYNYYVIYASPSAITHTSNRGELVIPWGYGYWVQGSESTAEYPYSRSFGVPLPASAWFGGGVNRAANPFTASAPARSTPPAPT